jgi:TP901 family phage tail tape measure protein
MSPEGQAKVNLILELKNRIKTGLTEAKNNLNRNVAEMKGKLADFKNSHVKAFQAMKDEIPGLARSLGMLTNPYVLLTAAVVAFGAASVKAARWSNNWEQGLAKVNVTAQLTKDQLAVLDKQIVDIGKRNAMPLEQIPEAFNRIISAGLTTQQSLKILEPTLRAAKAGFTDVETVAAAAVGTMASSGESITRVYDILFATLNKGNAEFRDVAQYLPKLIPLARGAGFALDETAGSWAYLTAQGLKAEQATTGLMNVMKVLSNPDIGITKFKSVGVDAFDASGKIRPLVDIIEQLSKRMSGLSDAQKATFLDKAGIIDMEAKSTILSMIQDIGKLKEITDFTTNSQGQLNKAYENAKTKMDDWKIISNQLKAEIWKPFGDYMLGLFSKLGSWVLGLIDGFRNWYNQSALLRDLISGMGWIIQSAFSVALVPVKAIYNLFKAIGHQFSSNGVIGKGIESFYNKIRPYFVWLKEMVSQVSEILFKFVTLDFKGAWQAVKNFQWKSLDDIRWQLWSERNENAKSLDERRYRKQEEENPFSLDGQKTPVVTGDGSSDPTPSGSIDSITGSAKQVKTLNVHIGSFVHSMAISNTNLQQMSEEKLEQFFSDMFMRVVRNVETSYQ